MIDGPALAVIAAAPFIGSFLGLMVYRLPRRGALVWTRSLCPACGTRLGLADLLPVASWLALAGRCRHCRAPISPAYPVIELAATLVALWSVWIVPFPGLLWSCALGWILIVLAAIDLATLTLPDRLTLPLGLAGLAFAGLTGGLSAGLWHLTAAAAGFLAIEGLNAGYRALRGRDGLGRGDAKLAAAAGAWVGLAGLPTVLLAAAICALTAVVTMRASGRPIAAATALPFGPALAVGLWLVWLYGPLIPS